jgi:hypothetical protein
MKKSAIGITAMLLIISIGNYYRLIPEGSMRTVDFLSSFAIGALSGILILQIAQAIKERKK